MAQNIIALFIVFMALGYTVFSFYRSLYTKKGSNCNSCSGCSLKKDLKRMPGQCSGRLHRPNQTNINVNSLLTNYRKTHTRI